jgi:hypothetical protein
MKTTKEKQRRGPNISSSMKKLTYYTLVFNILYSFIKITRRDSLSYA